MIYGKDYSGAVRACDNCGHTTNEYSYCAACEQNICVRCDHTCECRDCGQALQADGTCKLCDSTCGFCNEPMRECICGDEDPEDDCNDEPDPDEYSCCPDYAAAYVWRRVR